jgi:hypothetical protein
MDARVKPAHDDLGQRTDLGWRDRRYPNGGVIARQNKIPSARRSPADPFFAARSIAGSSNGFELKSSLSWRKKRQAAVPVQAAQQDMSDFPNFRAKHSNTGDNCS